ncbi:MAG TPA: carboxypeptidase regulatory-like domain-containing protein [Terriglobia bacterium]|nr:carboxypeptidase regulatory-like domain-containing protein [Terriglobia bacterium]
MAPKKIILLATFIAPFAMAGLSFQDAARSRARTIHGAAASAAPAGLVAASAPDEGASQITGRVAFQGTKPKLEPIDMSKDPVCEAKHKGPPAYPEDGEVNPNGTLPNVFVYVKAGATGSWKPPAQPVVLDQRGCVYHPHVLGIMVGQELEVVSSDATTHNVHPMPKHNKEWNQSQPPGAAPLTWRFTRPEVMIPVKCNQHPWMKAYIGVTSNPFYAVSGRDGTYTIRGLPPGEYTIEALTATFGTREQKVSVAAGGTATADFAFKAR